MGKARLILITLLLLLAVAAPTAVPARADGYDRPAHAEPHTFDAPNPRTINRAPTVEELAGAGAGAGGDNGYLESRDTKDAIDQPAVQRPETRAPRIDAPRGVAKTKLNNGGLGDINVQPLSPLVAVNKSGVKPQVLKQPKGAGSVKGMGLTFRTNLQTGSASLSIPIALPPARRGLGPSLALGYSSGGSQSIAGMGWGFGVGFIGRQTDQGLPVYDDDIDRFVYNGGRELVRVESAGTAMPSFAGPGTPYYRAKIEGLFMRFFRMTDASGAVYWIAQDTDGTRYHFGGTPAGGVDQTALVCESQTCDKVFRWSLVLVKDVHGNRVEYVYDKDQGQSYLVEVLYNNHPTQQKYQHRVVISYDTSNRPDVLTSYQPGYPVTTAWRIDEIDVFTDYGTTGIAVPGQPDDGDGRLLVRTY
ncbi:MAG: SpvB/TcaC N-terminal domain-containing protein, partial [bacterium]